ncbi:MAG: hypothetical protein ACLFQB_02865 [Chitinispirillaceae bacterium]
MTQKDLKKINLLNFLYTFMLDNLPGEKVVKFWKKIPLAENSSSICLFNMLWKGEGRVSLEYYYSVLDQFCCLFESENLLPVTSVEQVYRMSDTGIPLSSQELLHSIAPFADRLYLSEDVLRELYMEFAPLVVSRLFPGFLFDFIDYKIRLPFRMAYVWIYPENDNVRFDAASKYMGELLKLIPVSFSMSPAVTVQTLAFRQAECKCSAAENGRYIGQMKINDFCDSFEISQRLFSDDIVSVYENSDSAVRTAFGAPGYLFKIQYEHNPLVSRKNLLTKLISDSEADSAIPRKIVSKHRRILKQYESLVIFGKKDGRLFRNGKIVARDTTAYILKIILSLLKIEGRREFENREFMRDEKIVSDHLNPNLVVKLNRAFRAAEEKIPELKITKVSRGAFRVDEVLPFEYREE